MSTVDEKSSRISVARRVAGIAGALVFATLIGTTINNHRGPLLGLLAFLTYASIFGFYLSRSFSDLQRWSAQHVALDASALIPFAFFALLLIPGQPWWVAALLALGIGAIFVPLAVLVRTGRIVLLPRSSGVTAATRPRQPGSSATLPALRPAYPVRTRRLLLRPLGFGDVDALLAYRSRPDVCRYVPFEPMTREAINERLTGMWANTQLTDAGQNLTLGVVLADSGRLIGDVVLFWRSREHGGGEIGYIFNPEFGGHGYATEAVYALLGLGFDGLGLHRIVARIDERNVPSAQLARRLGMRQESRLVHNELFKGEWSTELDFAMLAEEWSAHRTR